MAPLSRRGHKNQIIGLIRKMLAVEILIYLCVLGSGVAGTGGLCCYLGPGLAGLAR